MTGMLFLCVSAPSMAEASLLSDFLQSNKALADSNPVPPATDLDLSSNSQNMDLLQAGVSPTPPDTTKDNQVDDNASVSILADSALVPATGPVDVSGGSSILDSGDQNQNSIYVVHKGDTVQMVADMFGISPDTILSANDMKKGDKLTEGTILLILPISEVKHVVSKGETLAGIAKLYNADANDIVAYNNLTSSTLNIGDTLLIPDASMIDEGGDKPAPNIASAKVNDQNYYAIHPVQSATGYFIDPVPNGIKTQGLHGPGHRGIDIGAPVGSPIYASASGTVISAKSGCYVGQTSCGGGYGNMVWIQHPNGTQTLYGHMSKMITSNGAAVTQGQIIGYVGTTGLSTGPHLHFEVFNAKNPGADWSWKK